ncbi:MAG: hypothetical protein ACPIGG_04475, partial [Akkermansiaceae bacterium]
TGDQSCAPVFEDTRLSSAFEELKLNDAKNIIREYTAKHDLWAWKRPGSLDYLDKVEQAFENPFYIIIFKDIFSIANRNKISMGIDLTKGLRGALQKYEKIIDFISRSNKPMLLVSADKILHNKEYFIDLLISINTDIRDLAPNKNRALEFITPNPSAYLDASRAGKAIGQIGKFTSTEIKGWAAFVHNKNASPEVELYFDDTLFSTVRAEELRIGPRDQGLHNTGACGFSFNLEDINIEAYKKIVVMVKGDVAPLKNGVQAVDVLLSPERGA